MRKHVISVSSAVALVALLSVAFAGLPESTTIQSGSTEELEVGGQTFQMTSVGVEAVVTFYEVTPTRVEGLVTKDSGESGTVTIRWVEANVSTTVQLSPTEPDQLFGLEGGDGDKRQDRSGHVNN